MEEVQRHTIHPCAKQDRDNLDEILRQYRALFYHICVYGETNEARKHRDVGYAGVAEELAPENQNPP